MDKRGKVFDRAFMRTLLTLALPIIIQFFLTSCVNMLDTLMIGRVGENELAAVGVAGRLYYLFHLTIAGVSAGCAVFMSQFWGKEDTAGIRRVVGVGLCGILFFSAIFTAAGLFFPEQTLAIFSDDAAVIALGREYLVIVCLSYVANGVTSLLNHMLRCIGNARAPMYVSLFAIICNGVLNYALIFGKMGFPAMGVRGAAIATVIARLLEVAATASLMLARNFPLKGKLREFFDFDFAFFKQVARKSAPVIANEGLYALGIWMYTIAYGHIGTGALAATQITQTVCDMLFVLSYGVSGAALVIVGNLIGAGDEEKARDYARRITVTSFIMGAVIGAVIALGAPAVVEFFNITPETAATAVMLLRIAGGFTAISTTGTMLIVGVFRGAGDAAYALRAEMFAMWCVAIPLAFLGSFVLGLSTVWVGLLVQFENVVKFFIGLVHLKGGKWIHRIVREDVEEVYESL
ncbi:MAG TPA: MATE family efflux transporter [Candidatus Acidoferrum sp.]|nr:MATE family efflux transporter [Candidatus Acidoferrum sp.]